MSGSEDVYKMAKYGRSSQESLLCRYTTEAPDYVAVEKQPTGERCAATSRQRRVLLVAVVVGLLVSTVLGLIGLAQCADHLQAAHADRDWATRLVIGANGAVATESEPCSEIGVDILPPGQRHGS